MHNSEPVPVTAAGNHSDNHLGGVVRNNCKLLVGQLYIKDAFDFIERFISAPINRQLIH